MEPRIEPLGVEEAPPPARDILVRIEKALGMAPNLHRTLAHAPQALKGYMETVTALGGGSLPAPLREQIAVATAGINRCTYCASAHTTLGQGVGLSEDELRSNLVGESKDPRVAAVLSFVRALVENRGVVTEEQVQAVRDQGYGNRDIVEIVAHVGMNMFTNMFNVFARTPIDFPRVELAAAS